MNTEIKETALYLAWKTAWRMRCCPPDNILYGESTKELQEHLESCLYCREELEQIEQYSNAPLFSMESGNKKQINPQVGQLWSIKQELGGWGAKKRYYSPPLVVITELHDDTVIVLQSSGDMEFLGNDDIAFQNGLKGFIQPWNQYSLCLDDLDICYGVVADELVKTQNPKNTQDIETGSLLWFFRQMEVETGYFFSSRAVSQLLMHHESEQIPCETAENPQALQKQLCDLGLIFQQPFPTVYSVQDLLFNAQIADDLLPLAASDNSTATEFAICLSMHNGKPKKIQPAGIHFTHWSFGGGFLNIVGELSGSMPKNTELFIRLQVEGAGGAEDTFFDPVPGEFGIEKDLFWALFQVKNVDVKQAVCIVRIIHEN